MTSPASVRRAFLPILAMPFAAILFLAPPVAAGPRDDKPAADAIVARMGVAEARYRQALVKIGNADPEGEVESNAALEDMEDAVDACTRQRGCRVADLLATYKRLLKLAADGEGALVEDDDGIDPLAADPDHAGSLVADIPEAARAAQLLDGSLLDGKSHRFDDMVQYNPAVQAAIRRWLTDMRGQLLDSHENYENLRQQMWP
jgi:membrane-bound lytic murein transglycosylase D